MPRGDKTGPYGGGPITGRGLGFCASYDTPGYMAGPGRGYYRGYGRGYGRGFSSGYGRGWGYRYQVQPPMTTIPTQYIPQPILTKETQIEMLKQEKEYFESEIKGITKSIEEITKKIEELGKET